MVKYGWGWMVAVEFLATMQPKKKKKQSPRFIKKKKTFRLCATWTWAFLSFSPYIFHIKFSLHVGENFLVGLERK